MILRTIFNNNELDRKINEKIEDKDIYNYRVHINLFVNNIYGISNMGKKLDWKNYF